MFTRIQIIRAFIILAIYAVGLPYVILRSTPSRKSLTEVDVTAASMEIEGKITGPWTLVIKQGDSQFRYIGLSSTAVAELKQALLAPGGKITALVSKNPLYLGQYFGSQKEDYEVFELAVNSTAIIPLADSVSRMNADRAGAIFILSGTCIVVGGAWVWRGRKRLDTRP